VTDGEAVERSTACAGGGLALHRVMIPITDRTDITRR
jgi:hypothetical protein